MSYASTPLPFRAPPSPASLSLTSYAKQMPNIHSHTHYLNDKIANTFGKLFELSRADPSRGVSRIIIVTLNVIIG